MTKICVFCSSMEDLPQKYINVARKTGQLLAEKNHHLIYGGSHRGLMGELSKSFAEHSKKITEIILEEWKNIAINNGNTILTKDLGERLRKMKQNSEAFITLPGGLGSLYETMDILISKQLGFHQKPLAIINTNKFYDPFITQLRDIINDGFAPKDNSQLIYVAPTPKKALKYIENYLPFKLSLKHLET